RRSDLNVLVVLKDLELEWLERATEVAVRWTRRGNPPMLFFTPELIRESQDVFPMEFLDIRDSHRVLAGEDFFREVRVAPENLRLQCESELKGKMIQLREGYLLTQGKKRDLFRVLVGSFSAVMTLCRAVLRLGGETSPGAHAAVIDRTCRRFGLEEVPFRRVAAWKRGEPAGSLAEVRAVFRDYYRELRKLQNAVNRLGTEPPRQAPGKGGK
ncbi:MAG: hypothetical protein HY509_01690, partial [Acidobacteria bacterium]|nr:hypothetical protein [Acidobacteriota bacterium]